MKANSIFPLINLQTFNNRDRDKVIHNSRENIHTNFISIAVTNTRSLFYSEWDLFEPLHNIEFFTSISQMETLISHGRVEQL